jgi:hypothetical protein
LYRSDTKKERPPVSRSGLVGAALQPERRGSDGSRGQRRGMISIDGRSMGCACIHAHGRVPRACSRLRLGADVMQRREQRRTAERSCRCGGNVIPAACVLADALPDPVGSLLCFPPCRCRRARQKRQDRDSVGRRVGDDPSVSRRTTGASCYFYLPFLLQIRSQKPRCCCVFSPLMIR